MFLSPLDLIVLTRDQAALFRASRRWLQATVDLCPALAIENGSRWKIAEKRAASTANSCVFVAPP
jgi:hypothetical protein